MNKEDFLALKNPDFQHRYNERGADYPESDIPDTIDVSVFNDNVGEIRCDFKNTDERVAERWLERYLEKNNLNLKGKIYTQQDGDYHNDWIFASAEVYLD